MDFVELQRLVSSVEPQPLLLVLVGFSVLWLAGIGCVKQRQSDKTQGRSYLQQIRTRHLEALKTQQGKVFQERINLPGSDIADDVVHIVPPVALRYRKQSQEEKGQNAVHHSCCNEQIQLKDRPLPRECCSQNSTRTFSLFDCGDMFVAEVVCALDGPSLAKLEAASRWPHQLTICSLPGLWRMIHVRSLGGNPPQTLMKSPIKRVGSHCYGGCYKSFFVWRSNLLSESDCVRHSTSLKLAKIYLESTLDHHVEQMTLQPMKACDHWLRNTLCNLATASPLDLSWCADRRMAPLIMRWHCHALVGAEAVVVNSQGFHTDQIQLFASWSVSFSAMFGHPRLYFAASKHSAAQQTWSITVAECNLPPRPHLDWRIPAEDILACFSSGRDLSSSLSGASLVADCCFHESHWEVGRCVLAAPSTIAKIGKDLFGPRADLDSIELAAATAEVLSWLFTLTCPNPFAGNLGVLGDMKAQLRVWMDRNC